tara:strand:- start:26 stop:682 length:657 start_codon:yes stop_codon:yes gene_type:complete
MYEAYRRMYTAVGVNDVDSILKPVAQGEPIPKDPAVENSESLENLPLTVFQGQNHDAHIMAHLVFGSSPMVSQMPAIAMALQKHVMEHVSVKAKEQVSSQVGQQLQGQPPDEQQTLEIESMVADLVAKGMQEVKATSTQISGGGAPDPIIALKQQDLELRAQQDAAENQIDQARLSLDQQKAQNNAQLGTARIDSQEGIVAARIQAAREREIMKQQGK